MSKEPKIKWNRPVTWGIRLDILLDKMDERAARESIKEETPNPKKQWGNRRQHSRKDDDR